jgi:hypothetical protein
LQIDGPALSAKPGSGAISTGEAFKDRRRVPGDLANDTAASVAHPALASFLALLAIVEGGGWFHTADCSAAPLGFKIDKLAASLSPDSLISALKTRGAGNRRCTDRERGVLEFRQIVSKWWKPSGKLRMMVPASCRT